MLTVLNVGGNNRGLALPRRYQGWLQILLDIDARGKPDLLCDARDLAQLEPNQFDAIYCSHTLEHFYQHDIGRVLAGFHHVLKAAGFAEICVPDLKAVMYEVVQEQLDIGDVIYESPAGPITVRDVIYGYGKEIAVSGNDFYAHKTGFTEASLIKSLQEFGFGHVYSASKNLEVVAYAFVSEPAKSTLEMLNLPVELHPVGSYL